MDTFSFSRRGFLGALGAALGGAALHHPAARGAVRSATGGEPLRLALVHAPDSEAAWQLSGFDLTHARFGDELEVLLWPGDLERLEGLGLPFRVTVDDLAARDSFRARMASTSATSTAGLPGARSDYRTLADHEADMTAIAAAHPDLARIVELPHRTWEGRAVRALELAHDVNRSDGRPTFYVDGLHHAREWPAGEHTIMFAFDIVANRNHPWLADLLERVRVLLVPVVNVDGFHHSRSAPVDAEFPTVLTGSGAYWRKNRRSLLDDSEAGTGDHLADDPTAYGVDNNRNYPFLWGGPGSGDAPLDQTYRGDDPRSEPETANVVALTASRQITSAISNHTSGEMVLRPWGHTWDDAPDEALLRDLGDQYGRLTGYHSWKGIQLYPTTGTTSDHLYGAFGALAYTFEHGAWGFHPPYGSEFLPTYSKVRKAFYEGLRAAADRSNHGVIRGRLVRAGVANGTAEVSVEVVRDVPTWGGEEPLLQRVTHTATGVFEVAVTPSRAPLADIDPRYSVRIGPGVRRRVSVGRGQVVDLGDIEVA